MTLFITLLHILVCFVLIAVILLQAGRGQGLTGPVLGSGNVQSLFGTKAGDFLTKATSAAAICFMLTCLTLDFIEAQKSRSLLETSAMPSVDVDQIRKALEKVKAEAAAKGESAANAVQAAGETAAADAQAIAADAAEAAPAAVPEPPAAQ